MKTTRNTPTYPEKVRFEAIFCGIFLHQRDAAASGTPQDVAPLIHFCMQNAPCWGLMDPIP